MKQTAYQKFVAFIITNIINIYEAIQLLYYLLFLTPPWFALSVSFNK